MNMSEKKIETVEISLFEYKELLDIATRVDILLKQIDYEDFITKGKIYFIFGKIDKYEEYQEMVNEKLEELEKCNDSL